jgi:hypothetical protein
MRNDRPLLADRRAVVPPVVLALLPFVLFAPLTVVDRVFSAQDVQAYFYPYHVLPAQLLAQGHLPLWNPYAFSGIPLLGDGQSAMFYPPNWLFFVLSGQAALNEVVLMQFSIAGVGMYLFARALGLWRLPAFIAALAYMFCGFLTARVVHLSIMSGAALIPVIFFCVHRLLEARYDRRWLVATSMALAAQALAGHPQIPMYTAVAVCLYALVRGLEQRAATGRWPRPEKATLPGKAYLLGYSLAAIQLVPWIELARLSNRAAAATYEFVFRTSTSGAEWLLFLFPYLLGAQGGSVFATGPIDIKQSARIWEHSAYVGILPLALAAVGLGHFGALTLRRWRQGSWRDEDALDPATSRHRWYSLGFFFILLVTGVLMAAGWNTPFGHVIYATPILGSLRAVERALVLATFALAILAGFGLQRVIEQPTRTSWLWLPAVLILTIPAFVVWQAHGLQPRHLLGIPVQDLASLSLGSPATFVPLAFALGSALLLAWWSRHRAGVLTQALAVGLVLTDMALYTTTFTPTAHHRAYRHRPAVMQIFQRAQEPFRKATVLTESNDLETRVAQDTLAMSWGMVYQVDDINGFNSLQPRRYTDYLFGPSETDVSYGYLRDARLFDPRSAILSSLNVRYVLVPANTEIPLGSHLQLKLDTSSVRVYENTLVYPRAYFADRVRGMLDPHAVLRRVRARGFDGRHEALVESSEPPALPIPSASSRAQVTRAGPNELRVGTTTAEPRFLVVSEMYFPGWRAYVDGVNTRIYRTNYLFRGIVVPGGEHTVRFVYRPVSVIVGAVVSALALVVCGLLARGRGRSATSAAPGVSGGARELRN